MDRHHSTPTRGTPGGWLFSLVILSLPVVLLGIAAYRTGSPVLGIGAVAAVLGSLLLFRTRDVWKPPTSMIVICLYLMALGWLWMVTHNAPTGYDRFAQGLLILASVGLLILHDLTRSGVEPRRQARRLTHHLLSRTRWPDDPSGFERLPEVSTLRGVVRDDPTLVFGLLKDPRPEVQLAGLTALLGRPYWRWEEAAIVLEAARNSTRAEVRATAIRALLSASQVDAVLGVAEFLRDASPEVREAAGEVVAAGGEPRWAIVRTLVRNVLSDMAFSGDGPLPGAAGYLSSIAVCDLSSWAVEPAPLSERAVRTLLAHYSAQIRMQSDHGLPAELGRQVTDPTTPQVLRTELALLLRDLNLIPTTLLDRMTDSDQTGPVRLLAVEILLAQDPNDTTAIDVLRGLGRQSNRETTLAIAYILQSALDFDLGLPPKGVPVASKLAAEVSQRVFKWATGKNSGSHNNIVDTPVPLHSGSGGVFGPAVEDPTDALGGLPASDYPQSAPGLHSAPKRRLKQV